MSTSAKEFSLPEYQVRISRRSRRIYLRLNPLGQLEVVLPHGVDEGRVPEILYRRREWIAKVQARQQAQWDRAPEQHTLMPERIHLQAVNEIWQVEYVLQARERLQLKVIAPQRLRLSLPASAPDQNEMISRRLQQWLTQYAKQKLLPWLDTVSQETGLAYSKACVRAQKTRWGSCSSKQAINLNRNLMFLPPAQVRYLFLHELCHTRYMNHSAAFWQQVAVFEPEYRKLDRTLTGASRQLPRWVHV